MTDKFSNAYFRDHSRSFAENLYVYPVVSRRSGGISLGINLSLRKECNFDCPYCQVDREEIEPKNRKVDLERLEKELVSLVELVLSGEIYTMPKFQNLPDQLRALRDIAISGDGESTTSIYFKDTAEIVLNTIEHYSTHSILPIVITNGSMLHKKDIREILGKMCERNGGPWVKLDASTEEEFRKVAESKIHYQKIISNIIEFSSQISPVILQMILYLDGRGTPSFELNSMISRLNNLLTSGARISKIQLYTLARSTRIKDLQPISEGELQIVAEQIFTNTGISVFIYP